MSPKSPNIDTNNQGSLLHERVVHSGSTEPTQHTTESHFEPVEGGEFPETDQPTTESAVDPAIHAAVVTGHRHKGQLGKHSAVEATGRYSDNVKPGMFLPGFGPVTYTNLDAAHQHAKELDDNQH